MCQAATAQEQLERSSPLPRSGAVAETSYSTSKVKAAAERSYLASEARGSGQEEQPQVQGAVAAQAQEGLEELSLVEGQEQWR